MPRFNIELETRFTVWIEVEAPSKEEAEEHWATLNEAEGLDDAVTAAIETAHDLEDYEFTVLSSMEIFPSKETE